jgi:hypothetical protein
LRDSVNEKARTLEFLYKILDDNQGTIRFLDTKAAFGIAVLGAVVDKLLDPEQLAALKSHGHVTTVLLIMLLVAILLCAFLGFETVFPVVNTAKNVSFPDNLEPRFFISTFSRNRILSLFSSSEKYSMLKATHAEYCAALDQATDGHYESVMAAEVLKLSFIRELKTFRLKWFARLLVGTVFLFMIAVVVAPKSEPQRQAIVIQDNRPPVAAIPCAPVNPPPQTAAHLHHAPHHSQ